MDEWKEEVSRRLQEHGQRIAGLEAAQGGLVGCRVQVTGLRPRDAYYGSYGTVVSVTRSQEGHAFVVVRFADGVLADYSVTQVTARP